MKGAGVRGARVRCCVPYCNRTTATPYAEWICAKHWRSTSKSWRRRYALFKRRGRIDLELQMWTRLKAQAVERAMGL